MIAGLLLATVLAVVGQVDLGLHPVEGVERRHQRQVELVLDRVAGDPREPVVGVDGVGAVAGRHAGQHRFGELGDEPVQRLLGHGRDRPGGDVVHGEPRLDVDDRRLLGVEGPGVHVAADARPGEGGGELADVDVHPAAVAGARLGQGRGVHREHGERTHGQRQPAGGGSSSSASVPLVLVAERQVYLDQRLLLVLGDERVAQDLAGEVVLALAVLEDPGPDVERLGGDPQRLGDLLEDLGGRLAQAALDLAEVRVGDPGQVGEAAEGQTGAAPLLADERTEVVGAVFGFAHGDESLRVRRERQRRAPAERKGAPATQSEAESDVSG